MLALCALLSLAAAFGLAGSAPAGAVSKAILIALSAFLAFAAQRFYTDTAGAVLLLEDRLTDSRGEVIVLLSDIEAIERGMFTLRPSNGFSLTLKSEAQPRWRMGLWWRAGKRAAFGGAASSAETKKMAEALEKRLGLGLLDKH